MAKKLAGPLVACTCSKCGRTGKTRRPRVDFLCFGCFFEKTEGRPINKDDFQIVRKPTGGKS